MWKPLDQYSGRREKYKGVCKRMVFKIHLSAKAWSEDELKRRCLMRGKKRNDGGLLVVLKTMWNLQCHGPKIRLSRE